MASTDFATDYQFTAAELQQYKTTHETIRINMEECERNLTIVSSIASASNAAVEKCKQYVDTREKVLVSARATYTEADNAALVSNSEDNNTALDRARTKRAMCFSSLTASLADQAAKLASQQTCQADKVAAQAKLTSAREAYMCSAKTLADYKDGLAIVLKDKRGDKPDKHPAQPLPTSSRTSNAPPPKPLPASRQQCPTPPPPTSSSSSVGKRTKRPRTNDSLGQAAKRSRAALQVDSPAGAPANDLLDPAPELAGMTTKSAALHYLHSILPSHQDLTATLSLHKRNAPLASCPKGGARCKYNPSCPNKTMKGCQWCYEMRPDQPLLPLCSDCHLLHIGDEAYAFLSARLHLGGLPHANPRTCSEAASATAAIAATVPTSAAAEAAAPVTSSAAAAASPPVTSSAAAAAAAPVTSSAAAVAPVTASATTAVSDPIQPPAPSPHDA